MSNQIQPFDFNGIQVRVLTDEHGNPWFLGADVCTILSTATNHIREYLDADEITNIRTTDIAQNGGKAPVFVSESGLYSLVLRSRKPEAREFKRWVTHEVLPSIRRHGAYMTESTLEKAVTEPDFLIRLATQIKQERAEKEKAQAQVERMRPKALFADAVETSKTSILIRYYCQEDSVWLLSEWCDHSASIFSFAPFEDKDVPKWNIGCRLLRTIVAVLVPECPVCGEKPTVQPDLESDIPQLVCSCNELLGNDGITNVYQRKHEWVRRCSALKRKQDNVREMEQLIERESE